MRRAIAAVGRTLVTAGLLILLFVAYQLWGTNILEARAQSALKRDFTKLQDQLVPTADPPTRTPPSAGPTTTTTLPPLPPIAEGDPVGIIELPNIGVKKFFVQGTSRDDLKKGPGHYPSTPMPGEIGNAAIAGHRTTYGAPFNRLDELQPGDDIIITLANGGRYVYRMREQKIVKPTETQVVENTTEPQLTLTTCNPKYSARERLVVFADLVVEESTPPVEFDPESLPTADAELVGEEVIERENEDGLQGVEHKSLGPAYGWGAIVALIGLAWWWFFRRWRHPVTWLAGVGPFLAFLFVFYVFLERALPAGY